MQSYDVVVIGGGVIGSAIAYFLVAGEDFSGSVAVIEPDPSYAACATTRSWGGVRQQFSTPENIEMSLFAMDFIEQAPDLLDVGGERPDLGFRKQGYLFLASAQGLPVLSKNCAVQLEKGACTALLDQDGLAAQFPWLNTEDLAGGGFAKDREGWIDPAALLNGLRRKAASLGATYLKDKVAGLWLDRDTPQRLQLESGGAVTAGWIVNAAGPWAGDVAALAGLSLPVRPRKRMTYVFDCRDDISDAPLTIDPSGVAFRPEGGQYLAIVSPPEDADPDSYDLDEDYSLFDDVIWPALAHRVPAFEAIKMTGAWAGHYDYNSFDQNAVIGPHPEMPHFIFCNGFSGHGLQQSPAAGRAVAELICHGAFRSIDLTRFGYDRLLTGRPLPEANVV